MGGGEGDMPKPIGCIGFHLISLVLSLIFSFLTPCVLILQTVSGEISVLLCIHTDHMNNELLHAETLHVVLVAFPCCFVVSRDSFML